MMKIEDISHENFIDYMMEYYETDKSGREDMGDFLQQVMEKAQAHKAWVIRDAETDNPEEWYKRFFTDPAFNKFNNLDPIAFIEQEQKRATEIQVLPGNPLAELAEFYLIRKPQPYPSSVEKRFKRSIIPLILGASVILSVDPSIDRAGDNMPFKIVYPASSLLSNFTLNAWILNVLWERIRHLRVPPELQIYMRREYHDWSGIIKKHGLKSLFLIGAGIASSMLPTVVVWDENEGKPPVVKLSVTVLTALNYIILNLFSGLQFVNVLSGLRYPLESEQCKEMLVDTIARGSQAIMSYPEFPNDLRESARGAAAAEFQDSLMRLLTIADYARELPTRRERARISWPTRLSRGIFGLGGALLGAVGWLGYILETESTFDDWFDNNIASWGITGGGSALLVFLGLYMGAKQFKGLFDTVYRYCRGEAQPNLALQRYPKTTIALCAIGLALGAFSYPTSVALVREHFAGLEEEILEIVCAAGIVILNVYGIPNIVNAVVPRLMSKYGNDDERAFVVLHEQCQELIEGIKKMSVEALYAALQDLPTEYRTRLLGISDKGTRVLLEGISGEVEARAVRAPLLVPPQQSRRYALFGLGSMGKAENPLTDEEKEEEEAIKCHRALGRRY